MELKCKSTSSNADELGNFWDMVILSAKGEPIEPLHSCNEADLTGNLVSILTLGFPQLSIGMESPEFKLQSIENEMGRGHWQRVWGEHKGLIIKSRGEP
jgi:hypothetical protein